MPHPVNHCAPTALEAEPRYDLVRIAFEPVYTMILHGAECAAIYSISASNGTVASITTEDGIAWKVQRDDTHFRFDGGDAGLFAVKADDLITAVKAILA